MITTLLPRPAARSLPVPPPVIDRRRPEARAYQPVDPDRRGGRGSNGNPDGRYERVRREEAFDGWDLLDEPKPIRTEVTLERARTIITRNDSPDIGFDRSINPYRGCEHGCSYCFARPSHAYQGLSPGLDFETKLFAKPNAAELLRKELGAKGYEPCTIALGTNTDPYQPIETRYRITRAILEVLAAANHPVGIVTKSALVARDIDILAPMAERGLAKVAISVTTLDPRLARTMEPRAATPTKRLQTIRLLAEAGIPVTVLAAPIIPALNDHEIEGILRAAYAAGAREAGYVLLRLPHELKGLVRDWLAEHYPDRMKHILSLVEETRGGKLYDAEWSQRQTGIGPFAWMIGRRFEAAAARTGFNAERRALRTDLFTPPLREGTGAQLALF